MFQILRTKIFEHITRSLVKTITYRVLIIITQGGITWLLTHDTARTFQLLSLTTVVSTILYYLHERIWNTIHWGRMVHAPEANPHEEIVKSTAHVS